MADSASLASTSLPALQDSGWLATLHQGVVTAWAAASADAAAIRFYDARPRAAPLDAEMLRSVAALVGVAIMTTGGARAWA